MRRILFNLFLCCITVSGFAQNDDPCVCTSYSNIHYSFWLGPPQDYRTIFPAEIIQKKGYRKVTVKVTGSKTGDTLVPGTVTVIRPMLPERREFSVRFDTKGLATHAFLHYEGSSDANGIYMQRDAQGRVTKSTDIWLDSTGKITNSSYGNFKTYQYNAAGNLTMVSIEEIPNGGLPGISYWHEFYEYDAAGKLTSVTQRSFHEAQPGMNDTTVLQYQWLDTALISVQKEVDERKNKHWTRTQYLSLNPEKILWRKYYFNNTKSPRWTKTWEYDEKARLLKVEMANPGGVSECPEVSYTDEWTYNADGLPASIHHTYNDIVCMMKFYYE